MKKNHKIVISVGEPSGIGPDIVIKLMKIYANQKINAKLLFIADPKIIYNRAVILGENILIKEKNDFSSIKSNEICIYPIVCPNVIHPGIINPDNSIYVLSCIKKAVKLCQKKIADAMVTCPVHKGFINQSGILFSGHSEFIAKLCNVEHIVMVLTDNIYRIALQTTHIALKDVSSYITKTSLNKKISIIHYSLKKIWSISNPRIGVCGLNPHIGENGYIGSEENSIIRPTIDKLNNYKNFNIFGPISADTMFSEYLKNKYDIILAMYHDQGIAPLKAKSFGKIINITLGLPFIRTSVDHGTALKLVGTKYVNINSLLESIKLANFLIK